MNLKVVTTAIVLFVMGGVVGRFSAPVNHDTELSAQTDVIAPQQEDTSTAELTKGTENNTEQHSEPVVLSDSNQIIDINAIKENFLNVDRQASSETYFESMLKVYQLDKLSTEDLRALLVELYDHPEANSFKVGLLLKPLMDDDLRGTADFIRDNLPAKASSSLLSGIFYKWADQSPNEVYQYVMENQLNKVRLPSIVFERLADSESSVDLANMLLNLNSSTTEYSYNSRSAIGGIIKSLSGDPKLVDIYSELTNSAEISPQYKQDFVGRWARVNFEQYSQNVDAGLVEAPGLGQNSPVYAILTYIETDELATRADWILKHTSDRMKGHAVEQVSTVMARTSKVSAQATLDWLDSVDAPNVEKSKTKVINNVSYSDPDWAITQLSRLTTDKAKQDASYQIYRSFRRSDPQKATEFMNESPFKAELEAMLKKQEERRKKKEEKRAKKSQLS